MSVPTKTVLASSVLFPSFQMQETGLEGFGVETVQPGANAPFAFENMVGGFGIQNRWVFVDPESKAPLLGSTTRVRFRIDDGGLFWEDLTVSPGPLYVLARPDFGTIFDIGLGPFQTEVQLVARDTGTAQVRVFAPVTLNPLGISNTDQDSDAAVKYTFRAGAGAGVDLTVGVGEKLLIGARTQGDYRYTYRAGEASLTHQRGDAEWILDAGIGGRTTRKTSAMATFFFQDRWQWTYDGPIDGVARGNQVIGGRLTLRTYTEFQPPTTPPPPEPPPPSG